MCLFISNDSATDASACRCHLWRSEIYKYRNLLFSSIYLKLCSTYIVIKLHDMSKNFNFMLVLAADIIYYKPLLSTKLLRKCSSYIDVVFNNLANANPPSEHILF